MCIRRRFQCCLVLLFSIAAGFCAAGPVEPLQAFNMHPLYASFIQTLPLSPRVLPAGMIKISLLESYGNNFFLDPENGGSSSVDADLDSEVSYTGFLLQWGAGRRLELDTMIITAFHYGGFLDPLIGGFHALFGFPNAGRELRGDNLTSFYLRNDSGIVLDVDGGVLGTAACVFESRYSFLEKIMKSGSVWDISAGAFVKIPVSASEHPLGDAGIDGGLRFCGGYSRGRYSFSGSAGIIFLSTPDYLEDSGFFPIIFPFHASAAWMLNERITLQCTMQGSTSPFDLGYQRTDNFTAILNSGIRVKMGTGNSLQISFSEEFFNFAATDIGFNIGWSCSRGI